MISGEINHHHDFKFLLLQWDKNNETIKRQYWYIMIVLIILFYFCRSFIYKSVTVNARQMLRISEHFWKSSINRKITATVIPWTTLPVRSSCLVVPQINVYFYGQVNMYWPSTVNLRLYASVYSGTRG